MAEIYLKFTGFLSNCDESILDFPFGEGYVIKKIDHNAGIQLLSELINKNQMEASLIDVNKRLSVPPSRYLYYIEIGSHHSVADPSIVSSFEGGIFDWASIPLNYLYNRLRLLRLYKQGNILMPISATQSKINNRTGPSITSDNGDVLVEEIFHLKYSEISTIQEFLKEIELPFQDEVLQMSFELFELSYTIANKPLSFLTNIMALENLLNPEVIEIKHRVSRNLAVLIGKDAHNVADIYQDMKKMYDKRSKIAHGRASKEIKDDDLLRARNYLREAIKNYYWTKLNKDDLLNELNELGFDSKKSWTH